MPTATVEIPASTDHVRLARLVAGAAARRCGVAEDVLDEVRLAVSEACARAVLRNQASLNANPTSAVVLELADDRSEFTVTVKDSANAEDDEDSDNLALALINSLAPTSEVKTEPTGSEIKMSWPIDPLWLTTSDET